jgi:hypothetical protein
VGACAQKGLLGDRDLLAQIDEAERVGLGAVTQAGAVAQRQMPGNMDTRASVHERPPVELRAEQPQDEQTPAIAGLWGPPAEHGPSHAPEQQRQPVAQRPRRRVGVRLVKRGGADLHDRKPADRPEGFDGKGGAPWACHRMKKRVPRSSTGSEVAEGGTPFGFGGLSDWIVGSPCSGRLKAFRSGAPRAGTSERNAFRVPLHLISDR